MSCLASEAEDERVPKAKKKNTLLGNRKAEEGLPTAWSCYFGRTSACCKKLVGTGESTPERPVVRPGKTNRFLRQGIFHLGARTGFSGAL